VTAWIIHYSLWLCFLYWEEDIIRPLND